MTTLRTRDELIADIETTFSKLLAFYEGPQSSSGARVGDWDARDTLAHFLFWHDSSTWAFVSASIGGPPWRNPGDGDQVNAAAVPMHDGESVADLLLQLRLAQARLLRAARQLTDIDQVVAVRPTGEAITARARLELLTNHWLSHLRALEAAPR